MWKGKTLFVLIIIISLSSILPAYGTGSITLTKGTVLKTKYGQLTVTQDMIMGNMATYANGTIMFNVTFFETNQMIYQFTLTSYGNGSFPIKFWGRIPSQVTANNALSVVYTSPSEIIVYSSAQNVPLIVIYGTFPTESQKVLFRDDFLYTNPLAETSWTIDQYHTPGATSYTSSGYLILKANNQTLQTLHVTLPIYDSTVYTTGTAVKRKMTVAMVPYAKTETPSTSAVRTGMDPLLNSGSYPGTAPYGTPSVDQAGTCSGVNPIGSDYMQLTNAGEIDVVTCGDGNQNFSFLEGGLNPSLYTVATIETYGIFCSTCADNAYIGSTWVYFRAYQEGSNGLIIKSTDKSLNFTSNIAPLFQTSYAFVAQTNSNAGATGQVSKIDIVQVQNYGSPVCLVAPSGQFCTRLPPVPPGIIGNNGIVGTIAFLANLIGGGDEQLGAIVLFFVLSFGFAIAPFIFTRHFIVLAFGELLTIGFYVYAGFFPGWVLVGVFVATAILLVMTFAKFFGGASSLSVGDESG